MAVFTPVSMDELSPWITQFPLGKVHSIRGIESGIENSNFFIKTDSGEFVLTIFEKLTFDELPFYLELMRTLAEQGILVPLPIANHHGKIINPLHGKPASIVTKLEGKWQLSPNPHHCAEVGAMLAKMHLAAQDFKLKQPNLRSMQWWQETTPIVLPYLEPQQQQLLKDELAFQMTFVQSDLYLGLTQGPIHADLFRNNVMFDGDNLSGFFDFYFAGCDTWLIDVAVTVNDWCINLQTGAFDLRRLRAMLEAYHAVRPFAEMEQAAWQPMLRAAALRFWLSRLYDFHLPRSAEMLTAHDPSHFERILRLRASQPIPLLFSDD